MYETKPQPTQFHRALHGAPPIEVYAARYGQAYRYLPINDDDLPGVAETVVTTLTGMEEAQQQRGHVSGYTIDRVLTLVNAAAIAAKARHDHRDHGAINDYRDKLVFGLAAIRQRKATAPSFDDLRVWFARLHEFAVVAAE